MVYRIKPIITNTDEIILPKCMYVVKSIHGRPPGIKNVEDSFPINRNLDVTQQVNRLLKLPTREMAELETRQEKLLVQLEKLHSQIHVLKVQLKSSTPSTQEKVLGKDKLHFPDDMVLSIDPNNPPYSLVLLRNILKSYVNIKLTFHLHSSTPSMTEKAFQFEKLFAESKENSCLPILNVRVIWKQSGNDAKLILSPTSVMPIQGESNILRYFASSIANDVLLKNSVKTVIDINSALDLCYILQKQSVPAKNKQAAAKQIISKLNAYQWLGGNAISIADLALYSLLQNVNLPVLKNPIIQKWNQQCTQYL